MYYVLKNMKKHNHSPGIGTLWFYGSGSSTQLFNFKVPVSVFEKYKLITH